MLRSASRAHRPVRVRRISDAGATVSRAAERTRDPPKIRRPTKRTPRTCARILLVHQPIDGGVGRHVRDLFEGLTQRGYDALLCGPALPSGSSLTIGGRSALDGIGVATVDRHRSLGAATLDRHRPLAMGRAIQPRGDLAVLARYVRIVRSLKPDLIHAHSSKAGAIARLAKLVHPRIPVLYTPHGYAFAGFFEHELERLAYLEAERFLTPLTRCVIAVCREEARIASAVSETLRVRVVHNGIDARDDRPPDPRVRALAHQGAVLCAVTQLRPGKGVETLIDALPAVIAEHHGAHLVIVGDGPLRDRLRRRADDRGVGAAVHFLGEHPAPAEVLRASDVFVLPSWAESFPYVILEAMLAGLPVLATDVGGISEAIVHGDSGLLVRPRDHAAISRGLLALLADAPLRTRLGGTARDVVRQRFTRAGMIAQLADLYEEVLSGAPEQ